MDDRSEREQMASAVRHDLRGCSRRIGSLVEVMTKHLPGDDGDARELLDLIDVNARRSGAIADALAILFALPPADREARTDMRGLVRECMSLRAGWTVAPAPPEASESPLEALGQPALVELAIGPLLDNAEQHGRDPRLCTCIRDGDSVLVTVRSDGEAITRDYVEHILRPMQRGHGADEAAAGMGLTLAERAAEALGGTLELGGAPGGGLVCRLRLAAA